ncbi:hypothetical protein EWM64_g3740 [Hericium alpestre]|uniref:Peptidase S54 rhomboid domain-containing protein n=1 Tax=Hericium alpestre TaxID=135208 RepID=A0A4Z0A1D1_9AGAM|nr:hypothetical protein EWM64_g3740 [Hericium alpestre]
MLLSAATRWAPLAALPRSYARSFNHAHLLNRVAGRPLTGLSVSRARFAVPAVNRTALHTTCVPPLSSSGLFRSAIARFSRSEILKATHRDAPRRRPSGFGGGPSNRGSWQRFVRWLEGIPQDFLFYGIIAANGAVFLGWWYAQSLYERDRDPSLLISMYKNFAVNWENVVNGRPWTLLTSCFSHQGFAHLFVNGFTFFFMAPTVMQILGNARFLALYFGGGIFSSLTSLQWHNLRQDKHYASLGASGAIYSVVSFFACIAPRATFLLFGIIPCPAWAVVSGIFLYDSYGAWSGGRQGTDTAGHVGGILAGIGYFLMRTRFRL